jgi:hypothetical protein
MPFPQAFEIDAVGPMPLEFHTQSGVREFLAWFEDQPFITLEEPQYLVKSSDWQCFLTGMARAYRDILIVVQAGPGKELEPVYKQHRMTVDVWLNPVVAEPRWEQIFEKLDDRISNLT